MKRLFFITVILISFVLFVLTTELLLRKFNPIYFCNTVSQFQYDKDLGIVAKHNLEKTILTDHIIEVFTNDIGSKNYLNKSELLEYKKIIFCVGDSYTEGVGNMTDESYPFYLDLLLNRKNNIYEKRFAVINLGLGAYGFIQSYLISKIYVNKIGRPPEVIVYFISANDFDDDIRFKSGYIHRHMVSGSPYYPPVLIALNELFEYNQIYSRIKIFLSSVFRKQPHFYKRGVKIQAIGCGGQKSIQFNSNRLPGLIDLIAFSRNNNVKLIISYSNYKSYEYDSIKKFASENNILFIDYKPDLERMNTIFTRLSVYNRHSGGHFRSWVNFIIASNIAELLKDTEKN